MDDITQLSPDGIIGMKHCQRTLDTKEVSQCNPFSTVIIFVLASDICTEAQTHSGRASFSIYLSQWKGFHRWQETLAQHLTMLHSLHAFTYGLSQRSLHCISFLFSFSPLASTPALPSLFFFPFQHFAAAIWTHRLWFIKHRQMKSKLFSLGKREKY